MRVGVRVPQGPPSARLEHLIGRLVDAGVDTLWWGDHLMGFTSPELWDGDASAPSVRTLHTYIDPFVMMAWSSTMIGSTGVGVCVTDAIRRMPATLVQSAITLDHVVKGTVILGLGAGEVANYRPYGWDVASPTGRLEEAARQMRRFLDSGEPDAEGALVALRPPEGSNGPKLWIAAHGPRGQQLAGECADGWFPLTLDPERWAAGRDLVGRAAATVGRDPATITMAMSVDVVIQDSHREADEILRHPAIRQSCLTLPSSTFARYGIDHPLGGPAFSSLIATRAGGRLLAAARAVPDQLVRDHVIHGTVDEVVTAIRGYEGLDHLKLSELSGAVRPGGGVDRLLAVMSELREPPVDPAVVRSDGPSSYSAGVERAQPRR